MGNRDDLNILRVVAVLTVMVEWLLPAMLRYMEHADTDVFSYVEHIGYTGVIAFFSHTRFVSMDRSIACTHQCMCCLALLFLDSSH
ncbi:MAG: hypothetical protein NVSMB62_14910 [Acidobacteriaceae bacterium]